MKKTLIVLAGTIFLFCLLGLLFRNWVLKTVVQSAVTSVTGFPTKISGLAFDFPSLLQIRGLRIENPKGFQNEVFADIPEIYADLDFPEILHGKVHLREVRLNLQEINIERNAQGISNAALLSSAGGTEAKKTGAPASAGQKAMPFRLDRFVLTLRSVRYEDHSGMLPGGVGRVAVDMRVENQIFTDIDDPAALVNLILLKIVRETTFGRLTGLNPDKLQGTLRGAVGSGRALVMDTASELTGEATSQIGGIFGKLKSAAREVQGKVANGSS